MVKKRKDSLRGYENFVSHVRTAHPEDLTALVSDTHSSNKTSERSTDCRTLFYIQKTLNSWMSLVVKALLPFNTTNNPEFRSSSRYGHIDVKTFSKYMDLLTAKVEEKVAAILPNKLAINFDGWSAGVTHYVAVDCTYPSKSSEPGFDQLLLAFSPMETESNQCADNHIEYLEWVLKVFGKSLANVVALSGDNCGTNRSISTKTGISFVRCSSHRFNLSVIL